MVCKLTCQSCLCQCFIDYVNSEYNFWVASSRVLHQRTLFFQLFNSSGSQFLEKKKKAVENLDEINLLPCLQTSWLVRRFKTHKYLLIQQVTNTSEFNLLE